MNRKIVAKKSFAFRVLALSAALIWVAADVALAGQGSAGTARSSSSKSSASGSKSSSPSSSSSQRSAVSRSSSPSSSSAPSRGSVRSGSQTRSGSGAARTRSGQRPPSRSGGGGYHGGYYGGGYYGGGYYGGYYGAPYYWSPWGYWGLGLTFGNSYGAYGHYPPVVYSSRRGYQMGALDLSVQPKNTEIYVDGQYVGLAKQYDGFPGHLWLESGVYEVDFYKPGFETQTRTVKVMTDLVLDLEIDMQSGVAVKPQMRFGPDEMERESDDELVQWEPRAQRGDFQARLHLAVEPAQALVYLDGNVLGTGGELAGLHAGLILSAGTHTLEVVHRGFVTVERLIDVEPGEEVDFQLTLKPAGGSPSP